MATQTGSIDLTATNSVKLFAAAGFKTAEQTYATKGELEVTNDAVALRATKTEASQMAQPNLAPLFSMDHSSLYNETTNPDGYWRTKLTGYGFTQLDDGWTHFEYDNTSGTDQKYSYIRPARVPSIVPGNSYTILLEIRNNAPTGTGTHDVYLQQIPNNQFWGNVSDEVIDADHVTTTTQVNLASCGASFVRRSYRLADTAHLTDDNGWLFTYTIRTAVGCTNSLDLRMSVYEGIYDGPYKPYSGNVLYATQENLTSAKAAIKLTTDGISTEVAKKVGNNEIISKINQSSESIQIQADKVNIEGATIFTSGRLSQTSLNDTYDAKGTATQTAYPNLTPYFVHRKADTSTANPDSGYWVTTFQTNTTMITTWDFEQDGPDGLGGWAHLVANNTGNSTVYAPSYIHKDALKLKASTKYTFLVEWSDMAISGGTPLLYTTTEHGGTNGANDDFFAATTSVALTSGSGYGYVSATTRATLESNCYNRIRTHIWIGSGIAVSGYVRVSLYEGEYSGPYKPYVSRVNTVKRTQRIYYRTQSSTRPTAESMPTAWVTQTGNKWSSTNTSTANWTTKVTPILDPSNSSAVKNLYLWTCEQREMADGSIAYTNVLLDDSTTVIDGGTIITGTVNANAIDADSGTFSTANIPELTANHIKASVINAVNNGTGTINADKINVSAIKIGDLTNDAGFITDDDIQIGGRNFLRDTRYMTSWGKTNGTTIVDGVVTFPTVTANTWREIYPSQNFKYDLIRNKQATFSCEANVPSGQTSVLNFCIGLDTTETANARQKYRNQSVTITGTGTWQKVSVTADITDAWFNAGSGTVDYDNCWVTVRPGVWSSSWASFQVRLFKLELGTKATDWTPAPEDQAAYVDTSIDSIDIGGRNLFVSSLASNGYPTDKAVGTQYAITGMSANHEAYQLVPVEEGASYIVQYWVDDSEYPGWACIQLLDENGLVVSKPARVFPQADYWTKAFTVPSGVTTALISGRHLAVGFSYAKLKFEKGTKATDWTPAPEDTDSAISTKLDASYNRIWYAECSTVAATTAKVATITPTTTSFTLVKGQTVNVLFTATNTAAVGDITLNVNNTGAKGIRYLNNGALNVLPSANYLRINQIVTFTYDGNYWVADFSFYDSNGINNARYRTQNPNAIKAATAITAYHIICGTSAGYKNIAANVEFNLDYPLLYATADIAVAATGTGNYLTYNGVNAKNNATVQGVATNKMVYLKGTVTGNTFKIAASNFLTCTVPSSADGVYIPLGIAYNTTPNIYFSSNKDLYAYVDGAFGPVSIREASAAAKTATNYISADSNGIKIANANPATATTYQHLTATSTEFVVEGDSMLELDGTNGARVGKEDGINTCVGSGGFYIRNSNDVRAGFEYEAASGSTPGNTTIESSDGLKLYGNVSSIDGTETGKTYVLLSGIRYNRDSEKASVAIVANSDPDNSSGDGNGSHIASIHLDGGNTSGDSIPSGEPSVSIHVGGESFDIGKPTSIYDTGSVSVANQSWVSVANLTIPSTGTWMVVVSGDFASNATGRRVVACTRNAAPSATPAYDSQNSLAMAPVNGAPTKFNSSAIIDFDADDVYYAGVWQNSGRALTTRIMIKAVRLI